MRLQWLKWCNKTPYNGVTKTVVGNNLDDHQQKLNKLGYSIRRVTNNLSMKMDYFEEYKVC